MPEILNIYLGRDNTEIFELQQDGVVVTADAVTRAVLRFGGFCMDTDDEECTELVLSTNNQRIEIQAGNLAGLAEGIYKGMLTIFDLIGAENGIAWQAFDIRVKPWNICPEPVVP